MSNHTSPAIASILSGPLLENHGIYDTESAKRSPIMSIPDNSQLCRNEVCHVMEKSGAAAKRSDKAMHNRFRTVGALLLLAIATCMSMPGIAVNYNYKIPLSTGEVFRFSLPDDANVTTSYYDLGIAQMTSKVEVVEVGKAISLVETPLTGAIYKATAAYGDFKDANGTTAVIEILRFNPVAPDAKVTERACLNKLSEVAGKNVDHGSQKVSFAGIEANVYTVFNPLSAKDNAGMVSIRVSDNTTVNVLADRPWFETINTTFRRDCVTP